MTRYTKFIGGAMVLAMAGTLHAQTATQSVSIQVETIDLISASGAPSLTISTAVPGSAPTEATSAGTYAITTNDTVARTITIQIDQAMPSGVTLGATLAAPSGGTSSGAVVLSTSPQNAVTSVSKVAASGLSISYTLDATVVAAPFTAATRTVTLTVIAGS